MSSNYAFIDGQNLHYWTKSEGWKVDIYKFRIYLQEKYKIQKAFYFLWCVQDQNEDLYSDLQEAWYIVIFREHRKSQIWNKKWNVDTDIVFEIMKRIQEDSFYKVVLVSWDWDYIKTVEWIRKKWRLEKILFPNNKYSSLYNKISYQYWSNLSHDSIKNKIIYDKYIQV